MLIQDGTIGTGKHKTALFMKKRDYAILFRPTQGSPEFGLDRARQQRDGCCISLPS